MVKVFLLSTDWWILTEHDEPNWDYTVMLSHSFLGAVSCCARAAFPTYEFYYEKDNIYYRLHNQESRKTVAGRFFFFLNRWNDIKMIKLSDLYKSCTNWKIIINLIILCTGSELKIYKILGCQINIVSTTSIIVTICLNN